MNIVRTIGKNIGSLVLAQIVAMIAGLIIVILVARFLGDSEYGKMSFAVSLTSILVIFADCGLNVMSIRNISRNKDIAGKYLTNTLIIKVFLALFTFALIYVTINFMNYPKETVTIVLLFGISTILNTFSEYFRSIFKSFEKMEYEPILNTIYSFTRVFASIICLYLGYGLIGIAYTYIFTELLNLVASFYVTIRKFSMPRFDLDLTFCKYLVKEALPFSMTIVIGLIYLKIDIVMLSLMKGDAIVGWYNAACIIIFSMLFLPNMIVHSTFPLMSTYYKHSSSNLKFAIDKLSKYLYITSLMFTLLIYTLADEIVSILYGNQFINSVLILKVLSLYLPLRFVNNVTGYALAAIDKEPFHALGGLVGAVINIGLNLILIPKYSYVGAATATVITEIALFVVYIYFIAKFLHKIPLIKLFLKPTFSFVCAIIVINLVEYNVFITVFTTIAIYIIALVAVKTFDIEDVNLFNNLIDKPTKM